MIWFNGDLIAADSLRVSPFDLGLTVGLGVFETMVAYDGQVFAYDLHHARMVSSADKLGLDVPNDRVIKTAISELIEANDAHKGRLRIRVTLSGGANPLAGGDEAGSVMVTTCDLPAVADKLPVRLTWVPFAINERGATAGTKSTSYANHVLALRHALRAGAGEGLMLNSQGQLAEGAMSNVFLVKDGVVFTPSLMSGCLPGVTRQLVIMLCSELGISVQQSELGTEDVEQADEIFLTSSLREVQAAELLGADPSAVGGITSRATSRTTSRIAEAYAARVREELS